jgi:hypothetical protein
LEKIYQDIIMCRIVFEKIYHGTKMCRNVFEKIYHDIELSRNVFEKICHDTKMGRKCIRQHITWHRNVSKMYSTTYNLTQKRVENVFDNI